MAAKKPEQDHGGTSMNAEAAARSDANQSTDAVDGPVAPSTRAVGEQTTAQDEALGATRSPIVLSPDVSIVGASNLQGSDLDKSELPGYRVTEVSSVLHDGTWYHQGDEIFLSEKEANPLLHSRVIEPFRSEK